MSSVQTKRKHEKKKSGLPHLDSLWHKRGGEEKCYQAVKVLYKMQLAFVVKTSKTVSFYSFLSILIEVMK